MRNYDAAGKLNLTAEGLLKNALPLFKFRHRFKVI